MSASTNSNALIKVSKCESGDIDIVKAVEEIVEETEADETSNETTTNSSLTNETERNESDRQVTVAEIRERNRLLAEANKTQNETIASGEEKRGFFRRFFGWIKRLFS